MDIRKFIFKNRSYTPIPFLVAALVFAKPTRISVLTGILLMILGEGIRFWGVAYIGAVSRITSGAGSSRLLTDGPFAHVRNPLYCGNLLLWSGCLVASWAWMPWMAIILFLFFVFQYDRIVDLEEEYLSKKFGESYEAYRKAVPMWVPRLRGYRGPEKSDPDWKRALRSERDTFRAIFAVLALILLRWRLS